MIIQKCKECSDTGSVYITLVVGNRLVSHEVKCVDCCAHEFVAGVCKVCEFEITETERKVA